jgi:uncharacterized phage protein (TIGR02218 family)
MTYLAAENSVQDGDPIFRLHFVQGAIEYKYTNAPIIISTVWLPSSISVGRITQSNELAKDPLDINVPRDSALGLSFLGGSPDQITSITVYREHLGDLDNEFQVAFKGRVTGASPDGDMVSLSCENIFSSMRRSGLRARYQKNCRHALYSTQCGVTLASYADAATATAVSGFAITAAAAAGEVDGFYTGGILEDASGNKRHITSHAGDQLVLMSPLNSLTTEITDSGTAAIVIYPGCAHTESACSTKFSNLLNYGGFARIPGETNNPFNSKITGSLA